jgi:prepilin-type N-terminal cleavage/methylation domain-containing protein
MCINERQSSLRAFTLVEMMVAIAVSGILLTALLTSSVYSSRSFAALENYVDLEQKSQIALDTMTKDIRQTIALSNYYTRTINGRLVTNVLSFMDWDGQPLTYSYTNNSLLKQKGGQDTTLLKNVDFLTFQVYQRNPVGGTYDQFTTSNAAMCKLVSVSWVCTRTILGSKMNSESVQTAKIVIRKQ